MFKISLEPVVFFYALGRFILEGAQVQADLLLWKICHLELNYTEEICGNLTSDEYDSINNEVQTRANEFLMISEWLMSAPALIFSFFAGALADNYGSKPFILAPMIGLLISDIGILINYIFIDVLPIEFFYIEPIWSFFGGKSVFYLGVYGFGTRISKPEDRASLLTRFDGFEMIAKFAGTLLSPLIKTYTNNYGNFGIKIAMTLSSVLYTICLIKEPPLDNQNSKKISVKKLVLDPLIETFKCLFQFRPNKLHVLIAIQFYMFGTYWFVLEEKVIKYLYMLKTFAGFDATQYSWYYAYDRAIHAVGLLLILPICSKIFKMHDSLILTLTLFTETCGLLLSAFCTELWQFYLAHAVQLMGSCKYGLVRSLLSKCVNSDETGKMFSALAILSALMPLLSNPVFRGLYNKTLDTFPAAEILLATAILFTSTVGNFVVYTQKWRIRKTFEEREESKGHNVDKEVEEITSL